MAKKYKKQKCNSCGKLFDPRGLPKHEAGCEQRMVDGIVPKKRKYTKRKTTPKLSKKQAKEVLQSDMVVMAEIRVEINLTRGLELGVVKIVQGPEL